MGSHPLNLVFRFLLELMALASFGLWGWKQYDGWLRILFTIGIPLALAIIWGTFAVPNDPSRSGRAPVVTPGIARLILELSFFGFAIWVLSDIGRNRLSLIMGAAVLLHYLLSYDRIIWLLRNK
ncbi:Protein of unknown function [Robiginitalea myxolifaciens]|uniref:DUF2568 domain-containing protein n=1 Tax=Robiginitalea myxolifaciens TaxID=400055 RepID=A0A1I6HLV5_9FLAO|nr:YrdB family protein [Robiginitalea myxolifaciens]SFR55260.1 Protein of unknown function [Robiginitalea myxolifaciens]